MKDKSLARLMKSAETAAASLKALAHQTRLLAVCHIGSGERTVGELEAFLGTTQSNISQHLAKLRSEGILEARRDGNQIFYRVRDRKTLNLVAALQEMFC